MLVQDFISGHKALSLSQLVALATRSDTGSHNRLDLIHNLVPTHYVCNGYVYALYRDRRILSNLASDADILHTNVI